MPSSTRDFRTGAIVHQGVLWGQLDSGFWNNPEPQSVLPEESAGVGLDNIRRRYAHLGQQGSW